MARLDEHPVEKSPDAKSRSRCAARTRAGRPCPWKAKARSRYCGVHQRVHSENGTSSDAEVERSLEGAKNDQGSGSGDDGARAAAPGHKEHVKRVVEGVITSALGAATYELLTSDENERIQRIQKAILNLEPVSGLKTRATSRYFEFWFEPIEIQQYSPVVKRARYEIEIQYQKFFDFSWSGLIRFNVFEPPFKLERSWVRSYKATDLRWRVMTLLDGSKGCIQEATRATVWQYYTLPLLA